MDKTQIDERLMRLQARAADVLGEPPDTSDAGGLSQVERAIQVGKAAVENKLRDIAVETAVRLREAANAEAARQVARCAAELGYVGEPATLAVAVGDACLAFARELREIHARHAVTVKRLEAEVDALKLAQVARDAEVKS